MKNLIRKILIVFICISAFALLVTGLPFVGNLIGFRVNNANERKYSDSYVEMTYEDFEEFYNKCDDEQRDRIYFYEYDVTYYKDGESISILFDKQNVAKKAKKLSIKNNKIDKNDLP